MKILTVSVACYNVAPFLDHLLESLPLEDCGDLLEVLLINDGSTDETLQIAERAAFRYPDSVRVISQPNGGHGAVISSGIRYATGRYFRSLDGDDWLDTQSCRKILTLLQKESADLVLSDYLEFPEGADSIYRKLKISQMPGKGFDFESHCAEYDLFPYHAVIYKTEMLRKCHMELDKHCFYVDTEYISMPVLQVQTAVYYDFPLYCYRTGRAEQSIGSSGRKNHLEDGERVALRMLHFYAENRGIAGDERGRYLRRGVVIICNFHAMAIADLPSSGRNRAQLISFLKQCEELVPGIRQDIRMNAHRKGVVLRRFLLDDPDRRYWMYRMLFVLREVSVRKIRERG